MKKVLFFAVIVLCVFPAVKAQDIVNLRMDRQQMGLHGSVASMDEDQLLRKDYFREDWPQRKWFVKDLRSVLREENGRIVTFNPAGRMLTVTYTYQGEKGRTTSCTYTSNGLLTAFTGEGYRIQARYSGNTADINVFAETKNYPSSVDIARDNLATATFTYNYPFDLKCRQELSDEGLVYRSSYYYVDSILARECEYSYNHNNLLTGEKTTDYTGGEKTVSITKYTYDNRGFLAKKTIHSKAIDATFTYENNDLGDCTKMTVERPYGTVVYTFEYQYDEHDNWTVRLQFDDGVFNNATLRSFTYHKETADKKVKADKKAKSDKKVKSDNSDKASKAAEKAAEKERKAAEKAAAKEAAARQKDSIRAEQQRIAELEKNMTKEERKAAQAQRKAAEKAAKEQAKADETQRKAAEKEAKAKAKAAEKERKALEKAAAKEKAEAEKAAKEQAKKAEKERKAAEKAAKK